MATQQQQEADLQQAQASIDAKAAALTAKRPGLGASDWEATCAEQGWDRDSKIVHLEGFIREMGLMPAFAAYAAQAAFEENEECAAVGDMG